MAKTAVAKTDDATKQAVALWEEVANEGFEGTTADDFSIPFLLLLQKGSPQCDADDGAYIEGAKPGQFYDTGTGELLDEVTIIPCHYHRAMVAWKPNRGGFAGQHDVGYEVGLPRAKRDDGTEKGTFIDKEGNEISDTRYFFCLRITEDGDALPVIAAFTSTQIKKARTWLTRMQSIKALGPQGKFTPPMYAHTWKFTSVPESNDYGNWKGYKIDKDAAVTDAALFTAAKEAREMFKAADKMVKPPEAGEPVDGDSSGGAGKDDDLPF